LVLEDSFYREFSKTVRGISVSERFCKTKFNKITLNEKYLFEFANRIGALILYIFIESARPLEEFDDMIKDHFKTRNSKTDRLQRKTMLSSDLIHRAIDIDRIFEISFMRIIDYFYPRLTRNSSRVQMLSCLFHTLN
jgi:hypothetical protein